MSDKDKAKPTKSVMGNLPSTRPTRMARRRDGEPVSGNGETEAKPRTKTAAKAAKKPTRATPKAVGKPAGKAAAKAKAAAPKPKAGATKAASGSKPRAVRSGSPSLDAAKKKPRARRAPAPEPPKGAELVTTAVQATGELAKIGLTLGSQAIKRAARKLPKP